jgi:23S rRNA pseudouridine1911/1915/1917 synthase
MDIAIDTPKDTFVVIENEKDSRIDKILKLHYPNYSRTYFQDLIIKKAVLVNGEIIKKNLKLHINDVIEIFFLKVDEINLTPENIPLDILYEDDHLIAINKNDEMVVHPAPGNPNKTFVNALLYHCKNIIDIDDNLRPGIVHRIDKNTTGVLIAAKTRETHEKLINLFSSRKIEKKYLCIAIGKVISQTISAPIKRHPFRRKEMSVLEGGKEAITHIDLLAYNGEMSFCLVKLETGRTHQIRVHLKHVNTPILGDDTYGSTKQNNEKKLHKQLLHAYSIEFIHPITKIPLRILAPIPDIMKKLLTNFECINNLEKI